VVAGASHKKALGCGILPVFPEDDPTVADMFWGFQISLFELKRGGEGSGVPL